MTARRSMVLRPASKACRLVLLTGILISSSPLFAGTAIDEESLLPFPATDQLIVAPRAGKPGRTITGVVEDISGQTIVLRRSASDVEVFMLRDVVRVDFHKSTEFDEGLRQLQKNEHRAAISSLRTAAATEPRKWAVREINAMLARAFTGNCLFDDALKTIESIIESDPNSRHVVELPLIWDERLPDAKRIALGDMDLQARSIARQLTAASSLLHKPEHQAECVAVLKSLSKSSNTRVQTLAETQLWRLKLLNPATLATSDVQLWHRQLNRLDRRTRTGPEFLCGRAHLLLNEYDLAATSLLWMPLLEPLDAETTRASLIEAISALELAGRKPEADALRASAISAAAP